MSGDWRPSTVAPICRALNTATDASGFVTVAHGGPSTPVSVLISGRNFAHAPYLTAVSATTFTVRFLLRSDGSPVAPSTAVSFDWGCFY